MTDNAIWILDLIQMQRLSFRKQMFNERITKQRFDKYSYCSWSLDETIRAIGDYTGYVTVGIIREILKMQLDDYTKYYNSNTIMHEKYSYAADTIEQVLKLTEGYVYND